MTTSQGRTTTAPRHSAGHRPAAWRRKRFPLVLLVLGAVATVALIVPLVATLLPKDDGTVGSATPARSTGTPTARGSAPAPASVVELDPLPAEVPRMRAVPLTGTARGAAPGTRLVVQDRAGSGAWTPFPLQPVVDDDGRFRTYVELGAPGVHQLRLLWPDGEVASDVLEVRVR